MPSLRHLMLARPITVIALACLGTLAVYSGVIYLGVPLADLGKFVDILFKSLAVLAAGIWSLTRYWAHRPDEFRVRIECDVSFARDFWVAANERLDLFVFRLDVINTSNVLIKPYEQTVIIQGLFADAGEVVTKEIYRWPQGGGKRAAAIEPGSWNAVNEAVPYPADARAIRVYFKLDHQDGRSTTWHKTFVPPRLPSAVGAPAG